MCVVKTLACLQGESKHAWEWGSWIDPVKSGHVSKLWVWRAVLFWGELWRWAAVCAHLRVLQHSSIYDLHQLCRSACSCQQSHLLLFCQAEQILESAGCRQCQLPDRALLKAVAELTRGDPWFSWGFGSGFLQWHWSPFLSLSVTSESFSNFSLAQFLQLKSTCITKFGTLMEWFVFEGTLKIIFQPFPGQGHFL